uniref:Uncharacterized protein n=1 Tax=Salix viminalis TaxID=40686 RepID=A0A6N2LUT1_SALVM
MKYLITSPPNSHIFLALQSCTSHPVSDDVGEACIHTDREVSFNKVMSGVPEVWKDETKLPHGNWCMIVKFLDGMGGEELFDHDNGFPKRNLVNTWKGSNGLYCVGFARNGLLAISNDAKNVSQDISMRKIIFEWDYNNLI